MGPSIATRASLRKREEAIKRMREDARASRGPAKRRLQDQDEESDDEDDEEEEEDDSSDADYDDRPVKVVARSRCVRSHISPRKHKRIQRSTDRVLTFLQNARMMNIPVRAGKWNEPEENYLRKLVYLFTLGVLDGVENKTSMRSWLSKMLNCCPMRISKKQMHGEKFKGKIKFKKCPDQIERMTQAEYEKSLKEVMKLRSDFLKHWAKEEFSRWNVTERMKGFDSWYEKVLATVPRPRIAKNNRLVEPRLPQMKEGWADVQQQFDLVQLESRTNLMVQQAGPMVRSFPKRPRNAYLRSFRSQSPVESPKNEVEDQSEYDISETEARTVPTDMPPTVISSEAFKPLVIGVDVTMTAQEQPCLEQPTATKQGLSSPAHLVFDFGPPSLWHLDEELKDDLTEEFGLIDDTLMTDDHLPSADLEVLHPYDLPLEALLQNVYSSCWPTVQS